MSKNNQTDMYHRWLMVFDKIIKYLEETQSEIDNPSNGKYSHRMERLQRKLKIPQIVFVILRAMSNESKNKNYLSYMKTWRKDLMDDYDQASSIESSEDVDKLNHTISAIKKDNLKIDLEKSDDLLAYKFMLGRYHNKFVGEESKILFSDSFFMDPSLYGKNNTVYYFSKWWNGTVKYDHDQVYSLNESVISELIADSKYDIYRSEDIIQGFKYGHSTACIHNEELFGRVCE